MSIKNLCLLSVICFVFSVLSSSAQEIVVKPSPAASPSPAPTPAFVSYNPLDRPDYKAYMEIIREREITKRLAATDKFIRDFPKSSYLSVVQTQKLNDIIRQTPNDKEKIYQQALAAEDSINTDNIFLSPTFTSSQYNGIVAALYRAGMDDKAEEISFRAINLIDKINAQMLYQAKYQMWQRLGQIYLRKNDLKKAESYFKQATAGEYEGNVSLLGLADVYGKRKKWKEQLDYLIRADARGALKKDQRAALETLYAKKYGSNRDLREKLDDNYKIANPLPIKEVKYTPTPKRSQRTVLAELFTGSECGPCVTIDTAFEGLLKRYDHSEVAVLIYDLHIPGPDPLTNPATVARAKFYNANSTPTYFINGGERQTGGGINRKDSQMFFDVMTPKIDAQLEQTHEADLKLSASMENNSVKAAVDFGDLKTDFKDLRLYIGLVENELSYMGGNGIRFHPMVVREMGGAAREGFLLKEKSGTIEWQFDLQKVSNDIKSYLDAYEQERRKDAADFAFTEKKDALNSQNLSVVAFIQDDKTKKVLQSAFVNLAKPTIK